MRRLTIISFASAAALTLAACGGEPDDNVTAVQDTPATSMEGLGPDTSVALSDEQQARYDATDWNAVSEEYDTNYEAMTTGTGSTPLAAGNTTASPDQPSGSEGSAMNAGTAGSPTAPGVTMPPRGEMDFAFLDRNDDGQLSVAEYAIWAVEANPTTPAANDQTRPYLRPEQINEAGRTFFHFDQDGSTSLSETEFQAARDSGRTPA